MNPLIKIRNFTRGLIDSAGRGKEPEGTFADSKNLAPTVTGSLETIHGYSTTGGLASLPTGFPDVTGTGTQDAIDYAARPFPYSSEIPSPHDGRVYFFHIGEALSERYALNTWHKQTGAQSSFVLFDERKQFLGDGVTIADNPTVHTITLANASATYGLSQDNDYYSNPPWRLEWLAEGESVLVTDYAYDSGTDTATFTVFENIGNTNGLDWGDPDSGIGIGDILILRRWFHQPTDMNVTFDTPAGQCFQSGNRVRGCGGSSSNEDKFPWIAQYIDRTFMTGVTGGGIQYKGTYIDQMELAAKPQGFAAAFKIIGNPGFSTGTSPFFPAGRKYKTCWTVEYDGYEESPLGEGDASTTASGAQGILTFDVLLPLARISKRATAINFYLREYANGVWSQAYFLKRFDIVTPTSTEAGHWTAGLIYSGIYGFKIPFSSSSGQITYADWLNRGGTYYARTGRLEETTATRPIVSWLYTDMVNGRRFYGNFYDPNDSTFYADQLRYTPIVATGSHYDVISHDRLNYEIDVASGDPGSIKGLIGDENQLYVFKDNAIIALSVGPVPASWVKSTISLKDGLYSPTSLVQVPERGVVFGDSDNLKLLRAGRILPITGNIKNTYFNLSGKKSIVCWYDKIDRSINFTNGTPADKTFYKGFVHMAYANEDGDYVVPFYKCVLANRLEFVAVERDGSVIFCSQAEAAIQKFHKTDYTFAGSAIIPYLKTNNIVVDESVMAMIDKVVLTKSGNANGGQLDCKVYLDGTAVTFTSQEKGRTSSYLHMNPSSKRSGRKVQVEYNYNAAGETNSAGKMELDGIDIYGITTLPPNKSV